MTRPASLLLLPGLLCDARLWRDQAAALAPLATPVVADLTLDDRIEAMAPGFAVTATSPHSPCAAMRHADKPFVAVQFHPEVAHTPHGQRIIERFVHSLAGCANTWTMANFIDEATSAIAAAEATTEPI